MSVEHKPLTRHMLRRRGIDYNDLKSAVRSAVMGCVAELEVAGVEYGRGLMEKWFPVFFEEEE